MKNLTARERTAYHEAGHVVAGILLNSPCGHVSIKRKPGSNGRVEPRRVPRIKSNQSMSFAERVEAQDNQIDPYDPEFNEKQLIILYSGCKAVQIKLNDNNVWTGFGDPSQDEGSDADQIADHLLRLGIEEDDGSSYLAESEGLLKNNWDKVERVVNGLLLKEKLKYREVVNLMNS